MATDSPRVSTLRCRPLRQSTNNIRLRPAVDDMSVICQPSNDKPSIDKLARCSGRLSVTHRSIQVGQCSTDTRPLPGCYIDRQSTEVSTALRWTLPISHMIQTSIITPPKYSGIQPRGTETAKR